MTGGIKRRNRAPGVWFRDDISDALDAVDAANWDVARHIDTPEMLLYRMGFEAAIRAMATAFGLDYTPRSRPGERKLRVVDVAG